MAWCDAPHSDNCWDVERIALHETGHVDGLGHNPVDDTAKTIMYHIEHSINGDGWQIHVFENCDTARLQVEYDVPTTSSPYSGCLSGLNNAGADGLKTTVTFSTSATVLCVNETATFSGTLTVQDYGSYGELGGNNLGSKTVVIQRSAHGQNNFVDYATATTNGTGAWSRNVSSSLHLDDDWRAHFDSQSGLNSDDSPSIRVQWLNGC